VLTKREEVSYYVICLESVNSFYNVSRISLLGDLLKLRREPDCTRCKLSKTADYVCLLGEGPIPCKVAVIGEAPGENEEKKGRPFVGKAGKILRDILKEAGVDKFFLTNSVACRPPGNRNPTAAEREACSYWLQYQLKKVKPKYVLLLGNIPIKAVLGLKGKGTGVTKLRGKPIERDGVVYLPTYHPAALLYDPGKREALEADVRLFKDIVDHGGVPQEPGLNVVTVNDRKTLAKMLEDLRGTVAVDIETSCLYPWSRYAEVRSIGFATRTTQYCLPIEHDIASRWSKKFRAKILKKIDRKLQDCYLVLHNGKFDSLWLRVHLGLEWHGDFDTMLAHYLLDENSFHGLKYLSQVFFGAIDYDIPEDIKTSREARHWGIQSEYLAKDVLYTRKLRFILGKRLHKEGDIKQVFHTILMPCSRMFTDIEEHGVYVDKKKMEEAEEAIKQIVKETREKLNRLAGREDINWNSPQQVSRLFYEDLKLEIVKRTDTGAASTDKDVLSQLEHPIAQALLDYRAAEKLLDAFINGWKPYLEDGDFLHPTYKLHGAKTGRTAAEDPNLQQTPRDKRIRSLITAPPGWVLIEADLSQIELRIAAELSGERTMLETFENGKDIHWRTALHTLRMNRSEPALVKRTARKIAGRKVTYTEAIRILLDAGKDKAKQIDERWGTLRFHAKAVNFGFVYGMYPKKFRQQARIDYGIEMTLEQATEAREAYFNLYPDLVQWHERQKRFVKRWGYVTSLSGRKRRLPAALSYYDTKERRFAERQAINTPVQSFGNELNFMAALEIWQEFSRDVLRLCGTVHDSVLMIVREENVEEVVPRVLEIMSHPRLLDELGIRLRVPIEAEANIGPWGSGEELTEWVKTAA